jgi:hypothetical protein
VKAAVAGVTLLVGTALGAFLGRLVYVFANPEPTCSKGPGTGPCWTPPAFWPYAVVGSLVGVSIVAASLSVLARSLDRPPG